MNIYIMYLLTILITMILFIIIKDKLKALRITGIITISSSFILISLSIIIKIIIRISITSINLSTITNYLFKKFLSTSLILFLIGILEIILSKYLYTKKKVKA